MFSAIKKYSFGEYGILLILVLIAAISRFYRLGDWSYWFDELYTVGLAYELDQARGTPIQFLLTRVSFELFDVTEWSARFFPALIGVVTVPIFYFLLRKVADATIAVLTSAFIVFSPWHLFHSQAARYYATVFLLGGLTSFCFYYGLTTRKNKLILAAAVFLILSVLTHGSAFLMVPSLAVFAGFYFWRQSDIGVTKRTVTVLAVASLALFTLLPLAFHPAADWVDRGHSWGYSIPHLIMAVVYNVGLPVCILGSFALLGLLYERENLGLFLLSYIAIPFFLISAIGLIADVKQDYLFFSVPGYFVLAAIGCARIWNILKRQEPALAIGFLCVVFMSLAPSFISYYSDGDRHPEKPAAQYIRENMSPNDIVLSRSPGVVQHYINVDAKRLNNTDLEAYKKSQRRIWFLVYYNRRGMAGVGPETKNWIYENARLVKEIVPDRYDYHDNSMRIFLFEPRYVISNCLSPNVSSVLP